jgi:hypothetical protein
MIAEVIKISFKTVGRFEEDEASAMTSLLRWLIRPCNLASNDLSPHRLLYNPGVIGAGLFETGGVWLHELRIRGHWRRLAFRVFETVEDL